VGEPMVVVGRVAKAHSIRGAIRARATGATLGAVSAGDSVCLRLPTGVERTFEIVSVAGTPSNPIFALVGVTDREQAERLSGAEILVAETNLGVLDDPDAVYVRDMIGCEVWCGKRRFGVVTDVHVGPANDFLEVEGESGALLIPFTFDAIPKLGSRFVGV
jgi:16S rRNA processing protein RimM